MDIFIPSYGRPDRIVTHKLFAGTEYHPKIVLHDAEQKAQYLKNPSIDPSSIVVADIPRGMVPMRRFIYSNLAAPGSWYLMLDDNIRTIIGTAESHYQHEFIPTKKSFSENFKQYKQFFYDPVSPERFMRICAEMTGLMDSEGILHGGFSAHENYFFRSFKYRRKTYVIGKSTLTKQVGEEFNWDPNILSMDDYAHTALHLTKVGKVLVNYFVYPRKTHFASGGIGSRESRSADRKKDVIYLMNTFPGMFRISHKKGFASGEEVRLTARESSKGLYQKEQPTLL